MNENNTREAEKRTICLLRLHKCTFFQYKAEWLIKILTSTRSPRLLTFSISVFWDLYHIFCLSYQWCSLYFLQKIHLHTLFQSSFECPKSFAYPYSLSTSSFVSQSQQISPSNFLIPYAVISLPSTYS